MTVTVVGPTGVPLPGVRVLAEGPESQARAASTDSLGQAVFASLPWDGSWRVWFSVGDPADLGPNRFKPRPLAAWLSEATAPLPIAGPEFRFVAATGLALQIEAVDGVLGTRVPAQAALVPALGPVPAAPGAEPSSFCALPFEQQGRLTITLSAPPDYVLFDDLSQEVWISPYARSLRYVAPLRREQALQLRVHDASGGPPDPRWVLSCTAAGRKCADAVREHMGRGDYTIRGIPFLPRELLHLVAWPGQGDVSAALKVRIPERVGEMLALSMVLPEPTESVLGIGGGCGGSFSGRSCCCGRSSPPPPTQVGTISVQVLDAAGAPVRGALVKLRGLAVRSDLDGKAQFHEVPEGEVVVLLRQVGLRAAQASVTVVPGDVVEAVLREPQEATLQLRVIDEQGTPLPFARVDLSCADPMPWIEIQDGVQRLDPFTDERGERMLTGVSVHPCWERQRSGPRLHCGIPCRSCAIGAPGGERKAHEEADVYWYP